MWPAKQVAQRSGAASVMGGYLRLFLQGTVEEQRQEQNLRLTVRQCGRKGGPSA